MVIKATELPLKSFNDQKCYRLINSKYPPISLFDDIADNDEFEALYAIQALTNPRLQNDAGNVNLVPVEQRPCGITGFNYAIGPFVHVSKSGTRFSNGDFGVFYAAEDIKTALAETMHHQEKYFQNISGLNYDRIVMRGLSVTFSADLCNIKEPLINDQGWYNESDYSDSQQLGNDVKKNSLPGIWYDSVRNKLSGCFALFSPKFISNVVQAKHYEYVWTGTVLQPPQEIKNIQ